MPGDYALAVLTVAILANAVIMTTFVAFALWHRGPLAFVLGRPAAGATPPRDAARDAPPDLALVEQGPQEIRRSDTPASAAQQQLRIVTRARHPMVDPAAHRRIRPAEDELEDVLQGRTAGAAYDKTIRILSWAFIIACLVIVSATDLWNSTRPQIMVVLALAGIFVLVVHELMPPTGLGTARFILEGTCAIAFLTMLVHLTGNATSPFFFAYPLLVGAAALVATPSVTLVLTLEAVAAYVLAALGQPPGDERRILAYSGVNLVALILLAYAGMVISREQRRTRNAAIRLSTVDSLTDLYNRAFFFNALDREIARGRRLRHDFCLLVMDVDGLKSVNDRYGHYHGDLLLRGVAYAMTENLRRLDIAARYGGDEFVVLLPETGRDGAYVVAEKIRQAAAALVVEAAGQQITTSLSIGIVSFPDDGQNADELMIAGDEAMYSSKRLGKNKIVGFASAAEAASQPEPGVRLTAAAGQPVEPGTGTGEPAPRAWAPQATPGFRPRSIDRGDEVERA